MTLYLTLYVPWHTKSDSKNYCVALCVASSLLFQVTLEHIAESTAMASWPPLPCNILRKQTENISISEWALKNYIWEYLSINFVIIKGPVCFNRTAGQMVQQPSSKNTSAPYFPPTLELGGQVQQSCPHHAVNIWLCRGEKIGSVWTFLVSSLLSLFVCTNECSTTIWKCSPYLNNIAPSSVANQPVLFEYTSALNVGAVLATSEHLTGL